VGGAFDSWSALIPAFERHKADAYADLCRACLTDPRWAGCGQPLPALHAIRLASLQGRATDPFSGDPRAFLADLDRLEPEVTAAMERGLVQFTEPLRLTDVLPGLLLATRWSRGRPLRVVEIGCSVGILLAPELFRIRYPRGVWDPASARTDLVSDLDVPPPLLRESLSIVERVGLDLAPVNPRDAEAYDYLRSFCWPGDPQREPRLHRAIEALQEKPPPVIAADALSALPRVAKPDRDVVTVIIESALSPYLSAPQALRLGSTLDRLADRTPLMLITRGPQTATAGWDASMSVVDLTHRRRQTYALCDLLSERTRWVGQTR
jgi:hypothetical protein